MLITLRDEILVVADYELRRSPNGLYKRVVRMRKGNRNFKKVRQEDFMLAFLEMVNVERVLSRWKKVKRRDGRGFAYLQVSARTSAGALKHFYRLTVKGHDEQKDLFDQCACECDNYKSLCNLQTEWLCQKNIKGRSK